jgi:hypothetical protein
MLYPARSFGSCSRGRSWTELVQAVVVQVSHCLIVLSVFMNASCALSAWRSRISLQPHLNLPNKCTYAFISTSIKLSISSPLPIPHTFTSAKIVLQVQQPHWVRPSYSIPQALHLAFGPATTILSLSTHPALQTRPLEMTSEILSSNTSMKPAALSAVWGGVFAIHMVLSNVKSDLGSIHGRGISLALMVGGLTPHIGGNDR